MIDAEAEQLREALPPQARLLVVADHGMVDCPAERRIDVDEDPELRDGLALIGGEARFRTSTAAAAPSTTWRPPGAAVLGDRAEVLTRDEAIARAGSARSALGPPAASATSWSPAATTRRSSSPTRLPLRGDAGRPARLAHAGGDADPACSSAEVTPARCPASPPTRYDGA